MKFRLTNKPIRSIEAFSVYGFYFSLEACIGNATLFERRNLIDKRTIGVGIPLKKLGWDRAYISLKKEGEYRFLTLAKIHENTQNLRVHLENCIFSTIQCGDIIRVGVDFDFEPLAKQFRDHIRNPNYTNIW